ncbi:MAG: NAD(P)H-dependent glycerol-3-phosphate dehydrogenase [Brevirhabdus sp.]
MSMPVDIVGAGAFGTALGVALARAGASVTMFARDAAQVDEVNLAHTNSARLPGVTLPDTLKATTDPCTLTAPVLLLSIPTQTLSGFLSSQRQNLSAQSLVACCKGVDLASGLGPVGVIDATLPGRTSAILTGPSFAADIARGLPTALTLACTNADAGRALQKTLSTPSLRLYRSTDVTGAELGGALKNVVAIAAGLAIGAGLGESARAALMTRGFAEMRRFAAARGARPETLAGLSGFGDLVLTCTSDKSRNFSHGITLGRGETPDSTRTVEGLATAQAVAAIAAKDGIDMPITALVTAVASGKLTVAEALKSLMARPLKEE